MGSILLDGAVMEDGEMIGAGSLASQAKDWLAAISIWVVRLARCGHLTSPSFKDFSIINYLCTVERQIPVERYLTGARFLAGTGLIYATSSLRS